ncbi:MAG: DUF6020 family protein [Lachnospiraceae bacterium]|nr:DUF6020 family protein [Lachnospiraceae bacterium]
MNKGKTILKKINIWQLLFSALFAGMIIIGKHITYSMYIESNLETVKVYDFHLIDVIMWIICMCIVYIISDGLEQFFMWSKNLVWKSHQAPGWKVSLLMIYGITAFFMVCWIPYFMSYWPGGIYSDTVDSINLALHKSPLDNHNPILYTLIWRFIFWITGAFSGAGDYPGLKLMTVLQSFVLAASLAVFLTKKKKKGLNKKIVVLLTLWFAVFPMYPFYGISLWKDTIFSIVIFGYSIYLYELFYQSESLQKGSLKPISLFFLGIGTSLIIFLRNNGIYIALFYSVVTVLLILRKKKRKIAVQLGCLWGAILVVSALIQGPVYSAKGFNIDSSRESMGIPIQQVAYIVSSGVELQQEDLEILEAIMPLDNWRACYNPIVTDTIKFDPSFNVAYFEENAGSFMKTYFHLVAQYPVMAVKAYFLQTMGFWDISKYSSTAYICNFHFGNVEYFMSDYFDYYLNFSFHNLVNPTHYMSAAIFIWIMIYALFSVIKRKQWEKILVILPTLGLWLSIMIAVPVAFSFRYIYSIFLCAPLYFFILSGEKERKSE